MISRLQYRKINDEILDSKTFFFQNVESKQQGDPTAGFFEEWKREVDEIATRNKSEFADLPEDIRVDYEGYRAGMYLRVEIENFPAEFINNLEIKYPIVIGGLLPSEQQRGTLQLRIKRHRWFTRPVLKSRDPLIFSLGPEFKIVDDVVRCGKMSFVAKVENLGKCPHFGLKSKFWKKLKV